MPRSRTDSPVVTIEHLGVHFDDRPALEDVSLAFYAGETVSVLGPNGAGKSTLLKAISGMIPVVHGNITFARQPTRAIYVPQRSGVDWEFPVSVLDVVLMARRRSRSRWLPFGKADRDAAVNALKRVGMERFAGAQIGELSGGQQQRVFLARALLQNGDLYLLDEPFTGVDVPTQELLIELFGSLREEGKTIIYATHDLEQAVRSSDRIVLIRRTLIAAGEPADVMTASNLVACFGGQAIIPFADATRAAGAAS